ncbi:hypothetical protein [Helicobacter sp. 13S00477-4]|uniref:hypothetical protein n=1 Tax=Helicobacter sp. 13S00477-4 TaxID=1905759 RepID=UPI0015DA7172|nr:hypothetical protein [Helicobacter sp. 13S00477-4]
MRYKLKSLSIPLLLVAFISSGCASKKPKVQETFTTIKCEMVCKDNQCNQKCEGVKETH